MFSNLKILLVLTMILTACGDESSAPAPASNDSTTTKTSVASRPETLSIATASDMPECSKDNNLQLVYVRDAEAFYSCEDSAWVEIEIKGKDGKNGKDGVTTVQQVTAPAVDTTPSNQWSDPVNGRIWLLVTDGSYAQATASCVSGYHIPSWAEAQAGITDGVLTFAATISSPANFWIRGATVGAALQWNAYLSGGTPTAGDYTATQSRGVFCVKD